MKSIAKLLILGMVLGAVPFTGCSSKEVNVGSAEEAQQEMLENMTPEQQKEWAEMANEASKEEDVLAPPPPGQGE